MNIIISARNRDEVTKAAQGNVEKKVERIKL